MDAATGVRPSTSAGGKHSRAPAHENKFAFRHNPGSKKTAAIARIPNNGVCGRCHDIIEWKKKYRKYKRLTTPGKCAGCHLHCVRFAYHALCGPCASSRGVCAKCRQAHELWGKAEAARDALLEEAEALAAVKGAVPGLPERERRSKIRALLRAAAVGEGAPAAAGAGAGDDGKDEEDDDDDSEGSGDDGEDDDDDEGDGFAGVAGPAGAVGAAGAGSSLHPLSHRVAASVGAGTATSSRRTAASATAAMAAAAAAAMDVSRPPSAAASEGDFAAYMASSRVAGDVLSQALAASKRKGSGR